MFLEAMEDVLPTLQIVIDSGDGSVNKYYPITSMNNVDAAVVDDISE